MMCNRCMLVSRSELVLPNERVVPFAAGDPPPSDMRDAVPMTQVPPAIGPAVTVLNGEALCMRHWLDSTEPGS